MFGAGRFDHLTRPALSSRLVKEIVSLVDSQKGINIVLGDLPRIGSAAELVKTQVDEEKDDWPQDVVAVRFEDGEHRQDVQGQRGVTQQHKGSKHQLHNVVPVKTQSCPSNSVSSIGSVIKRSVLDYTTSYKVLGV